MAEVASPLPKRERIGRFETKLIGREWLSEKTFELHLKRPPSFRFEPGQRIQLLHEGMERDYSLASAPGDDAIALCIRRAENGQLSPLLSTLGKGSTLHFTGPHGYFIYRSSSRQAIFIASGTGISPFISMVRSGITGSWVFHGVNNPGDLYYQSLLRRTAQRYVPCISGNVTKSDMPGDTFYGRVAGYLKEKVKPGAYDFYLCGRSEMIRDVILLIDEQFTGSIVYTERFF